MQEDGLLPETGLAPDEARELDVSRWRWYCLVICSGVASMQGGYWNNFGPISAAVKPFFGWHDGDIALLANWGPIMFLIFAVPFAWLMDTKGVKWSCVVSATLLVVGSVCRVLHVQGDRTGAYLMHAGQIFTAIPGPVAMGIGPLLAAAWFPPQERTTATAICAVVNYGGSAVMYLLGPLVVKQGSDVALRLWEYMLGELLLSIVLLVGAVIMPAAPNKPPSLSAEVARMTMADGFLALTKHRLFWPVAVSYALIAGFLGGWGAMLGPNMEHVLPSERAETDAGLMGFWGAIAGMVMGIMFGVVADRITGRKKPLIFASCVLASGSFFFFACLCSGVFGNAGSNATIAGLYVASIFAAVFCNAMIPLFFEMSVEASYPVGEGITITALTILSNIATFIFLGLQMAPGMGTGWMNWACAGACLLPVMFMARMREHLGRLDFDQGVAQKVSP